MKNLIYQLQRTLKTVALAVTGLGLSQTANAALTYTDGDLFLCFRATGNAGATTDYMVNIGQATQFTGASGAVTVNLGGSILADIENTYGTDWKTRTDLFWSVSGVQSTAANGFARRTMFATRAEPTPGTQSTPWTRPSLNGALVPVGKMVQMATPGYDAGTTANQTESTISTKALLQATNAPNSYASYMPLGSNTTGTSAFSYFNAASGIEANFANGTASSVLDLYKLENTTDVPGSSSAVLVGGFRLNDSAELTFNTDISQFQGPAQVSFELASVSALENSGNAVINIIRAGNLSAAVTVNFSTANGTASSGTDFTGQTNTAVSFAANETIKTVNVAVADIAGYQGNRDFTATLAVASGNAQIVAPASTTVTIQDDEPQPSTLAFSAATFSGNETAGTITVTINRTGATATAVSVNLSTADDTALAGTDYTGQTNTAVNFAANDTSKTVDIAVTNRPGFIGNRAFTVALSGGTNGATLGTPSSASVTIVENDPNPAGRIAFSSANYRFASKNSTGQPNTVELVLNRTIGTVGSVSVSLAQTGGNLDALDFTFTSPTTVTFADGVATQTVNFPLLAGVGPLPGTINFAISNPTNGATLGAQATTTVTVTAPDAVAPKLVVTSPKSGKTLATFNVTGSVIEPDNIDRVEVRLNGSAPQPATLGIKADGATPFTLNGLSAENGPNVVTIQAFDVNGTASKVTTIKLTYVNERLAIVGEFNGLAVPTLVAAPAGDKNNASGLVTIKVGKTGSFSGKVQIGGVKISIKGIIANSGAARFSPTLGTTFSLVKKAKPTPIALGDLALTVAGDVLTGTIGTTATVAGNRASFDGKTVDTTVSPGYLANKGKYTAVFPSETQAGLTIAQFPQGDGIGFASVDKKGKLKIKGTLADGSSFSVSTLLTKAAGDRMTAAIYAPLYSKRGSIAGNVTFSLLAADSDFSGSDFLWLRPNDTAAKSVPKYYPAGWPAGITVDVTGALYNATKQTPAVSVFPGLNVAGEADIQLTYGNPEVLQTESVLISTANKVTNVPATDKTYKLSISASSGALSGDFTKNNETSKTKYKGVIYQKGATKGGYGFSLSNVIKNGPSGTSGGVTVVAKP